MKRRSSLSHIVAIASVLLLSASLPAMAHDRSLDEKILPFYYGVSNYYQVPKDEVLAVHSRLAPEEVPVAFHIAARANVSPIEVAEARAAGHGWVEVGQRYGVGPAAFHVPMERAPGPPYGNAWGYYRNKPQHEWDTIRLTDREVVDLVNLRFLSEHYGLDRHDIVHRRSLGHGHDRIATDVSKRAFRRHDRKKGRVTTLARAIAARKTSDRLTGSAVTAMPATDGEMTAAVATRARVTTTGFPSTDLCRGAWPIGAASLSAHTPRAPRSRRTGALVVSRGASAPSSDRVDGCAEPRSALAGDLGQLRVVDRLHRGERIDGGDLHLSVELLHDDVARQHGADLVLCQQGSVGERRVAGAEDAVGTEGLAELLLEGLSDVDVGQDAETSFVELGDDALDRQVEGEVELAGVVVAHDALREPTSAGSGATSKVGWTVTEERIERVTRQTSSALTANRAALSRSASSASRI